MKETPSWEEPQGHPWFSRDKYLLDSCDPDIHHVTPQSLFIVYSFPQYLYQCEEKPKKIMPGPVRPPVMWHPTGGTKGGKDNTKKGHYASFCGFGTSVLGVEPTRKELAHLSSGQLLMDVGV